MIDASNGKHDKLANFKILHTVLWNQASSEEGDEPKPDLRSRGLCLVPLSCTSYVTNENGGVWPPTNYRGGAWPTKYVAILEWIVHAWFKARKIMSLMDHQKIHDFSIFFFFFFVPLSFWFQSLTIASLNSPKKMRREGVYCDGANLISLTRNSKLEQVCSIIDAKVYVSLWTSYHIIVLL